MFPRGDEGGGRPCLWPSLTIPKKILSLSGASVPAGSSALPMMMPAVLSSSSSSSQQRGTIAGTGHWWLATGSKQSSNPTRAAGRPLRPLSLSPVRVRRPGRAAPDAVCAAEWPGRAGWGPRPDASRARPRTRDTGGQTEGKDRTYAPGRPAAPASGAPPCHRRALPACFRRRAAACEHCSRGNPKAARTGRGGSLSSATQRRRLVCFRRW